MSANRRAKRHPTAGGDPERRWLERVLGQAIAEATTAAWGFQNRTDIITLANDDQVVLQRYRRQKDARYRLEVMSTLQAPAAAAGLTIPTVRACDLESDPPWIVYDALPGVPVAALEDSDRGPRLPALARAMGHMLATFRQLPIKGVELDQTWVNPDRLVARAVEWANTIQELDDPARSRLAGHLTRVPELFQGRPVVLAHGDFSPVNILSDGAALTGLVDFESLRLADALFDVAWWDWSVSFSPPAVHEAALPEFLGGAGIDTNDPELIPRIQSLQLLRMLELLAGDSLGPGIRRTVANRLHTSLDRKAP